MTKQELEKAIEKGKSVWYLYCNEVYEIKIKNHTNRFINKNGNEEMYNYTDENGTDRCFPIKALYKSKAEAEHYLHHANVSRTETLPFLTWEEFLGGKELFFTNASGYPMCLMIVDTKLGKKIGLGGANGYFDLQKMWDLTEANFYKAYDEAVRLFKGEV